MSVKSAPPPRRLNAAWIGAGILCAGVLALLWITAHQIKERKMRVRYGEEAEPAGPPPIRVSPMATSAPDAFLAGVEPGREVHLELPPEPSLDLQRHALEFARRQDLRLRFVFGNAGGGQLALPREADIEVEHFSLRYGDNAAISVHDARGRHAVDFTGLNPGETRRWQELEFSIDEIRADRAIVAVTIRPGSPCLGAGRYHYLKQGLTIQLAPETRIQIRQADPTGPEIRLQIIEGNDARNASVSGDEPLRIGDATLRLERDDRSLALIVESGKN